MRNYENSIQGAERRMRNCENSIRRGGASEDLRTLAAEDHSAVSRRRAEDAELK